MDIIGGVKIARNKYILYYSNGTETILYLSGYIYGPFKKQ